MRALWRVGVLLLAALPLLAGSRVRACQYLYSFLPAPALTLDVMWPTQPAAGFDWRYGIPLAANADDHDTADIYEWNQATQQYEFWTQMEIPGSPEIVWTCSWGVFSETGTSEAVGYASVQWMPTEPLQDTVTIECEANDRHDTLGFCDAGNRDDDWDAYDGIEYDIRYPEVVNVASRRRTVTDPALGEGNVFGYYNIVQVLDNWGAGFEGLEVRQDLAAVFQQPVRAINTHSDTTSEAGIQWTGPDASATTDANGWINNFDLVQSFDPEAVLQQDSPHVLKRVFVIDRQIVRRMYFNPLPLCSGQHLNTYPTLPPP